MGMNWWEQLDELDQNALSPAALDFLAESAAHHPEDFGLRIELAQRYQAAGNYSYAIGAFMLVAHQGDHHQKFRANIELAACFEALDDTEGATLALTQARKPDPGSHWPVIGLARLLNDPSQAIVNYPALRPDAAPMQKLKPLIIWLIFAPKTVISPPARMADGACTRRSTSPLRPMR